MGAHQFQPGWQWHETGSRDLRLLARWLDERAKLAGPPPRPLAPRPVPAERERNARRRGPDQKSWFR